MKINKKAADGASRTRLIGTLVLVALVLVATVGTALASGGAEHGGGGGLPQLNPGTFATQLFWLGVSFLVLYFLMFGVALPRVEDVLNAREGRIAWDITKADEIRNESNAILAATDRMLERTKAQAQEIISRTSGQGQASGKMLMDRFDIELSRRTREAEQRILTARNAALGELDKTATDLAQQVANRLAGVDIDRSRVADAVKAAIKERD
ncbi:MAG: F0F1 ATP synthase subunit B' [Rhodospirillaceae bacterium]